VILKKSRNTEGGNGGLPVHKSMGAPTNQT